MRKRRKKRRRRKYIRRALLIPSIILIIISGISFGLLELYQYLNKSSHLRIKKLIVKGDEGKLEKYVTSMLNPQKKYMNIIFLNTDDIRKKIEINPYIKSVKIKKEFPDTLIINIEKEIPYALINIENDLFYVDMEGYLFKKVNPGEYVDLPVITGLDANSMDFKERLKKGIKILRSFMETNPHKYEISEIHITKYGNVHLYFCHKDIEVVLTHDIDCISQKEIQKKLLRLKKVLNYFSNYAQIKFVFIDLDSIKNGVIIGLSK